MRDLVAVGVVILLVVAALSMATALRWSHRDRERTRRRLLRAGRTIVAEVPVADGVEFFTEDAEAFHWTGRAIPKRTIRSAQLLISGAPLATVRAQGAAEPSGDQPAPTPEHVERERWDVAIATGDDTLLVACGSIRQQVSQELARSIFAAVRAAVDASAN